MKYKILKDINFDDISRYVPKQYLKIIDKSLQLKTVDVIHFFGNKDTVVSSRNVEKAFEEISGSENKRIVSGGCFTIESRNVIRTYGGLFFALDYFEWSDESYARIRKSI